MSDLERQGWTPSRLRDWLQDLATSLLFFKMKTVANAEAASIHEDALLAQRQAFSHAIEATRYAKETVSDDADEAAILEVFIEGTLAQTQLLQHMLANGATSGREERQAALARPTTASRAGSPTSPVAETCETTREVVEPRKPRGRPKGSKTKPRSEAASGENG